MKKTGAFLTIYALEQIGVKYTFGIPGVHNTEIYDALNNSEKITPVLVTHEGGGAFMADGLSRTSDSIGTLVIVPAAGATHALSGIGEAYLDGIPMLIISGGTRRDSGKHYQLHQLDLGKVVGGLVKKYFLIEKHEDLVATIFEAYHIATSGEPGPVFVEIPVEIQMFQGQVKNLPEYQAPVINEVIEKSKIEQTVKMLTAAKNPGIYVGWGTLEAADETKKLAEALTAPVSTTLQGLSVFPGNHPLHAGLGFGPSSLPSARKAFADCDCLLAVGVRFSELATGSFGMKIPKNLIHIDINPEVFNKNYPAKLTIEGDAKIILNAINKTLEKTTWENKRDYDGIVQKMASAKKSYLSSWIKVKNDQLVSPGFFFQSLRKQLPDDAFVVVDDGKHTFLTAELFPIHTPGHFISPTDFNCMGYCVPAAIGVKMSNREKVVAAIVGDGAFMMTGMEMITAASYGLGLMVFVFHDGELGQISQFQSIPMNRKTCSVIGDLKVEGVAIATGSHFLAMKNDGDIEKIINRAMEFATKGEPVIVDVNIDYSKKTLLTKGVVKTNLGRFPFAEKVRFISRAIKRNLFG